MRGSATGARSGLRGLLDAGDPHGEVRTAWHAKETVRGIYGIRHSGPCSPIHPPARRRPRRRILPTRDQQARSHHHPLERPDHQRAHVEGNQQMPPKPSTTSSNGSNEQRSGYPTSRTTESGPFSTPGNPTGTYWPPSLPTEIRRARKGGQLPSSPRTSPASWTQIRHSPINPLRFTQHFGLR